MRCSKAHIVGCVRIIIVGVSLTGCKKAKEAAEPRSTQAAARAVSPPSTPVAVPRPTTRPGRIAPNDVLSITVFDLIGPGIAGVRLARVSPNGTIRADYIDSLPVAGLTDAQAEEAILKAYSDGNVEGLSVVQVRRLQVGGNAPVLPIGNFDLIRISICDLTGPGIEYVTISRVDDEGVISLPYLGKLKLAGSTEIQAEDAIIKAYTDANLIAHARVSVFRLELAPPGAEHLDLPDVPLQPVPDFLKRFYEVGEDPSQIREPKTLHK